MRFWTVLFLAVMVLSAQDFFTFPNEQTDLGKDSEMLLSEYDARSGEYRFMYNLAKALLAEGKYEQALINAEAALALNESDPWGWKLKGDILLAQDKRDEAKASYEKALEQKDSYEFLPVWDELVVIAPEYYANLGLLYRDKARENKNDDLAQSAIDYLGKYPGGPFEQQVESGINEMEIFLQRTKSQERQQSQAMEMQRMEMERKMEIKASRESFMTERPYLVGVYFNSFVHSADIVFETDDIYTPTGNPIIDNEIDLDYAAGALNDFHLTGGYVHKKWILKAGLSIGKTNVGKGYDIDSVYSEQQDRFVLITEEIGSVRSLLFNTDAYYNLYYTDPILLYAGGTLNAGRLKLETKEERFDPEFIAGAGIGGGLMLHFDNFLVDLNIKVNAVGSSSGTVIGFGGMYKF